MLYAFTAVQRNGESITGEREAADTAALARELQNEGLLPIKIGPAGGLRRWFNWRKGPANRQLSDAQILAFTRELSTLMNAGFPLDRSLAVLLDLTPDDEVRIIVEDLRERIQGGSTFSEALAAQSGTFSRLFISLVKAGESAGALDSILERLGAYLEESAKLREQVRSAMTYPLILLTVAILSIVLLLAFVVPQFKEMFEGMGADLPAPTQVVVAMGDLFRDYWWAIIAGSLLVFALVAAALQRPELRERWDRWVLRLPLIGELIAKVETARIARTLSTLLDNGLTLLAALGLMKDIVSNRRFAATIDVAETSLKGGKGFADPLLKDGALPSLSLQMIKVGEETGQMDKMLTKVADIYDAEVKSAIQRLLSLLEPMLIVGLGVVVAGIIISILVAIMQANQLAF